MKKQDTPNLIDRCRPHTWLIVFVGAWLLSLAVVLLWLGSSGLNVFSLRRTWITVEFFEHSNRWSDPALLTEQIRNFIGAFFVLIGSLVGAFTLGNAYRRTSIQDQESEINSNRLRIDTFSNAVDQLGNGSIGTRIGAIYTLEGLARQELSEDSDKFFVSQILETLAGFARDRSNTIRLRSPNFEDQRIARDDPYVRDSDTEDVSVVVEVIARTFPYEVRPSLESTEGVNLEGAFLKRMTLPSQTDLRRFNLRGAIMEGAKMAEIDCSEVSLEGANLDFCDLRFSKFNGADFKNASVKSSLLWGADLSGSNVDRADFYESELYGANLTDVNTEAAVRGLDEEDDEQRNSD